MTLPLSDMDALAELLPHMNDEERAKFDQLMPEVPVTSTMADFMREAWHVVEPGKELIWNWHLDAMASHMQAVTEGKIRRLIVNVPPGTMKSLGFAVFWPAWEWTFKPEIRSLFASYAGDLALRDSVRCRSVIESDWYRSAYKIRWRFSGDQNLKSAFENTRKGSRLALGVGGKGTGFRGDKVVVDDSLSVKQAYSEAARENVRVWWRATMSSRVNDLATGAFVVIGQRLHESDLPGDLIKEGGYELLCLPSEFVPERRSVTYVHLPAKTIFWQDPRTTGGELLFPKKFPKEVLDHERTLGMGPDEYTGQHQQSPVSGSGNVFKREWWKRYPADPEVMAESMDEIIQSWDFAFKGTESSDFVVGQVWGRRGAQLFLLDQVRDRMTFVETKQAVIDLSIKWPMALLKLMEDKANGSAVMSELQQTIPGMVPVEPDGDKVARARAISPFVQAENVWLPQQGSWVGDFITEHASFPRGSNDDQVDAMSQALRRFAPMVREYARHLPKPKPLIGTPEHYALEEQTMLDRALNLGQRSLDSSRGNLNPEPDY